MSNKLLVAFAARSAAGFCLTGSSLLARPDTETLRGWLSDELCGKGRAESGKFTGQGNQALLSLRCRRLSAADFEELI